MAFVNVGKGFLMKSANKKSENSPDFTGKLEVNIDQLNELVGEDGAVQLSAWTEESKSGKKYLSIQLSVMEDQEPAPKPAARRTRPVADDDVPF